jgi:hypothetical protein
VKNTPEKAWAAVQYLLNQREPVRLNGGAAGLEAEYTHIISIPAAKDVWEYYGKDLVIGPDMKVVVEAKEMFRGPADVLYRTAEQAVAAGGTGEQETVGILEFVSDVMRVLQSETRYPEPRGMLRALREMELRLNSLQNRMTSLRRGHGKSQIPLADIFPAVEGYRLTDLGRQAFIGGRPIGDWPGAHFHYTVGVPLGGLYPFLQHVSENTWRDESVGYLTRAHLSDGLRFGEKISEHYSTRLSAAESAELKGYLTLLYSNAAAYFNHVLDLQRLGKAHVAVLSRHAMADILRALPVNVQRLTKEKSEKIFEEFNHYSTRRITQSQVQRRNVTAEELEEISRRLRIYVRSGLDPQYWRVDQRATFGGMSALRELDTTGGASLPLVVMEVRSYGKRHVEATAAATYFKTLAREARKAYAAAEALGRTEYPQLIYPAVQAANPVAHTYGMDKLVAAEVIPGRWAAELDATARPNDPSSGEEYKIDGFRSQPGFPKDRL